MTLTELSQSDSTLAALRALRDRLQRDEIDQAAYEAEFQRLNLHTGVPCKQCMIRLAHSIAPDGRRLCAQCGAKARGI
jgi:hypothetical protein